MRWSPAAVLSLAVHAAGAAGIAWIPKRVDQRSTMISVVAPKKAPKPEQHDSDKKPDPPKPAPAAPVLVRPAPQPKTAPPPEAPPPPAAAAPPASFDALPDLGSLDTGQGGLPVRPSGPPPAASDTSARSAPPPPPPPPAEEVCNEPDAKPKPNGGVQPQYTEAARAAGVEGRVRVLLAVDASGNVTSATVQGGLGYGLDEAAVAAARAMKFKPATHCGRPIASSFTVSMRFVLGE